MARKDVLQSLETAPFGSMLRLPVNGSDLGVFARMMRAGTGKALIGMGKCTLHPRAKVTQQGHQGRSVPLQTTQPNRNHVRLTERSASRGNPLWSIAEGIRVSHRSRNDRDFLVMSLNLVFRRQATPPLATRRNHDLPSGKDALEIVD
ncbi:MAG: hypothetical protein ACJA1E_002145 [Paracoccaceae bacterium]|jgi:hypothetical protein